MHDRYGSPADMQIEPIRGRVKIRIGGFSDPVAMPGHLALRENSMRQLFADLREGIHFLDQDISMTILVSHAG